MRVALSTRKYLSVLTFLPDYEIGLYFLTNNIFDNIIQGHVIDFYTSKIKLSRRRLW